MLSFNNFSDLNLPSNPQQVPCFNLQHVQRVKMWNLKMSSSALLCSTHFHPTNEHEQMHLTKLNINITLISCLYSRILLSIVSIVDSWNTGKEQSRKIKLQHKNWNSVVVLPLLFLRLLSLRNRDYKGKLICPGCQQSLNVAFILHFHNICRDSVQGEG